MAYVNRDPFARQETHKEFHMGESCAWCGGQTRKQTGAYLYRVESDGGRVSPDTKYFCSLSCRTTYYS